MKIRSTLRALPAFGLSMALVAAVACRPADPRCFEGELRACSCGEAQGYARCTSGEPPACECDAGVVDAQAVADAGVDAKPADADTRLPFLVPCSTNEECTSGECFSFAAKGRFCTKACKVPEDCPSPSTGCNNQGLCKAP